MTMQMQNQRDGIDEYETDSPSSVEADDFKNPLHSAGLASPSTTTQVGSGVDNVRLQNIRREQAARHPAPIVFRHLLAFASGRADGRHIAPQTHGRRFGTAI